jgi:predicted permease
MWNDLIFAIRTLRRNSMFTIFATLSLALGIGATTAIFSLMDQVLIRMLPVRDPGRLVLLHREYQPDGSASSDNFESVFSYPMYRDLRDRDPAFRGVVARATSRVALSHRGVTQAASAELVSGNFFEVLGVGSIAGRVFTSEDDRNAGAHPVAVLSHAYWVGHFGGDPSIVGQTLTMNGHPLEVVGVAAPGFNGLLAGSSPDIYVPLSMQKAAMPTLDILADRQFYWLNVFARLQPGFSIQHAQAASDVAYRSMLESELAQRSKPIQGRDRDRFLNHRTELHLASQGINELRRKWEKPLVAVMIMVGLLLLITCANVAGLLLARAAGRQREIAIRLALGAGRIRLIRQLLVEGLVLALIASAFGLLGALWASSALIHVLPEDLSGNWLKATIDFRLLVFNTLLSALCGLFFGLIPALQATRPDVSGTLKDQAKQVSGSSANRMRKLMVTAQVAFSLALLVVAGLFSESLFHLLKVDLGFHTERLLTISVDASPSRPDLPGAVAFYRELQDRLTSIGGVQGAAAGAGGPLSGDIQSGNITVEGYRATENENTGSEFSAISPQFFHALGIPLRMGREFTVADAAGAQKVVVVNEAFVKKYFGSANPIGRRLMFGGGNHPVLDRQIVGVVGDSRKEVRERAPEMIYYPYAQWQRPARLVFYVRTEGDETQLGPAIQRLVRSIDSNVAVGDPKPMTLLVNDSIYTDRLIAGLSVAFGVLATLMAAIGLYGVIGYAVARRTSEIGLRMALGAVPGDVLRMVLGEAARMVVVGVAVGAAAGVALGRVAQSELFGIEAANPLLVAAGILLIALVTASAACIPAWRASRIDPVSALKYE